MDNVHELLEYKLQTMWAGEKRTLEMLEDAVDEVEDEKLRQAFAHHAEETRGQVKRIEQVFAGLGRKPRSVDPSVIEGLVEERRRFLSEDPTPQLMDAFLLAGAIKTEHIEIGAYESLLALAERAGASDVFEPLGRNLEEERATLEKLRTIAQDLKVEKPMQPAARDAETQAAR